MVCERPFKGKVGIKIHLSRSRNKCGAQLKEIKDSIESTENLENLNVFKMEMLSF